MQWPLYLLITNNDWYPQYIPILTNNDRYPQYISYILLLHAVVYLYAVYKYLYFLFPFHQECKTWLNIAMSQEDAGQDVDELDSSYASALRCAEKAETSSSTLQVSDQNLEMAPVLLLWRLAH